MKKLHNLLVEVKRRRNPTNGKYTKNIERIFHDFLDVRDKYQRYVEDFGWDGYIERIMREMARDFKKLPFSVNVKDVVEDEFDGRPDMDENTEMMSLTFEVVFDGQPTENDGEILWQHLQKNKESDADFEGIGDNSLFIIIEIM